MQHASHGTTYKYYCNFLSLLFHCHGIQSGSLFLFLCPLPFFLWSQAVLCLSRNSHLRMWCPCFVVTLTCPPHLMSISQHGPLSDEPCALAKNTHKKWTMEEMHISIHLSSCGASCAHFASHGMVSAGYRSRNFTKKKLSVVAPMKLPCIA